MNGTATLKRFGRTTLLSDVKEIPEGSAMCVPVVVVLV
jgi:hypothetical protein